MSNYQIEELTKDVYLLRLNDTEVKYFESNWYIPEGITYNAYLIKTNEGSILFDLWKAKYANALMDAINKITEPSRIRYVVINHAEPDHTGSITRFSEENPEAIFVGIPIAESILKAKYNFKNKFKPVRNEEELSIGDAKIRFYYTPWVHWPETMMSYYLNEEILFTCDAFGSYSIQKSIFDENISDEYMYYAKKYLVTVIGTYRENLIKGIDKIEASKITPKIIAPSHGLIWKNNPTNIIRAYRDWAEGKPSDKTLVVVYASMYGSIAEAVENVVRPLRGDNKVKVFSFTDEHRDNIEDILTEINSAKAVLIASPTYETGAHPSINYLLEILATKIKGVKKPAVILTSYAWGSTADKKNLKLLQDAGFEVIDQATFKEKMTEAETNRIVESLKKALD